MEIKGLNVLMFIKCHSFCGCGVFSVGSAKNDTLRCTITYHFKTQNRTMHTTSDRTIKYVTTQRENVWLQK